MNTQAIPAPGASEADAATDGERGFGLVEVVVSMFILALIALSLLPLLITGLRQSMSNTTMATATAIVQGQMVQAQAIGDPSTCGALVALGDATWLTADSRGVELEVTRTIGACPSVYPGTVAVSVSVTRTSDSADLAVADTLVFVQMPN